MVKDYQSRSVSIRTHDWKSSCLSRIETYLVVFILEFSLSAFGTRTDSLGIIAVKSTTGLSVEQLGAVLVVAGNQQSDTERSAHYRLLSIRTLTEAKGQVTDGLGAALDAQGLVVVEVVALAFDTGVLNHGSGVSLQTRHGATDVAVDFDNLFDRRRLEKGGGDSLLDTKDDAFRGGDANGRGTELDCFEGVFDLKQATFGGEGVDASVYIAKIR